MRATFALPLLAALAFHPTPPVLAEDRELV